MEGRSEPGRQSNASAVANVSTGEDVAGLEDQPGIPGLRPRRKSTFSGATTLQKVVARDGRRATVLFTTGVEEEAEAGGALAGPAGGAAAEGGVEEVVITGLAGEWWFELYFDLVFVAAFLKMGYIIHTEFTSTNLTLQLLLFILLWSQWTNLEEYMTRHHICTMLHLALYALEWAGVVAFSMNLASDTAMERAIVIRHVTSLALVAGRVILLLMYGLSAAEGTLQCRGHPRNAVKLAGYALSAVLFLASVWAPGLGATQALWAAGFLVEVAATWLHWLGWEGEPDETEEHVEHTQDRHGCFVMLVLGESVIQFIASPSPEYAYEMYSVAFLAGIVCFCLAILHFDTANSQVLSSCCRPMNKVQAVIWTHLNMVLSFFLLMVGVAIKGIIYYIKYKYYKEHSRAMYYPPAPDGHEHNWYYPPPADEGYLAGSEEAHGRHLLGSASAKCSTIATTGAAWGLCSECKMTILDAHKTLCVAVGASILLMAIMRAQHRISADEWQWGSWLWAFGFRVGTAVFLFFAHLITRQIEWHQELTPLVVTSVCTAFLAIMDVTKMPLHFVQGQLMVRGSDGEEHPLRDHVSFAHRNSRSASLEHWNRALNKLKIITSSGKTYATGDRSGPFKPASLGNDTLKDRTGSTDWLAVVDSVQNGAVPATTAGLDQGKPTPAIYSVDGHSLSVTKQVSFKNLPGDSGDADSPRERIFHNPMVEL